jgi:hypothetical protein
MDIGLVLEHLRAQFKEQMVLYAGDLAKILNKSEKAVQQLISRGSLPFQVKSIGGRKCVDIFQVAKWLASDLDAPEELNPSKENSESKSAKPRHSSSQAGRSSIGKRLMERRHAQAAQLLRLADSLQDIDEGVFLRSIVEKYAFPSTEANDWGYKVSCKSQTISNGEVVRTESSVVYADLQDAMASLGDFLCQTSSAVSARVKISKGRSCVFLAMKISSSSWVTIRDDMKMLGHLGFSL